MGWWSAYEPPVMHPGSRSAKLGSGERDVDASSEPTAPGTPRLRQVPEILSEGKKQLTLERLNVNNRERQLLHLGVF